MSIYPYHEKVLGWRMPEHEDHFVNWMLRNPKKRNVRKVDGRYTYQYHKYETALQFVPQNRRRVALDIGAHVGLWSWYMARDFEYLYSFEPAPPHIELYKYNMRDRDNWTLLEFGLADKEMSDVPLKTPEGESGNTHIDAGQPHPGSLYTTSDDFEIFKIDIKRLDDIAEDMIDGQIDFIKIDVEGFELPVVQGAEKIITEHKPVMVIEQKGVETIYGIQKDAAKAFLEGLGMRSAKVIAGDHIMVW
jgi:FkbM family methyltransferase